MNAETKVVISIITQMNIHFYRGIIITIMLNHNSYYILHKIQPYSIKREDGLYITLDSKFTFCTFKNFSTYHMDNINL